MSTTDLAKPAAPESYLLFDRADDEAVIARVRGASLQQYVYAFKQGGQMIYGLGIDGAEACKRELALTGEVLEEEDVQIERDEPDCAYFKARVSRWAVNKAGLRIKLDSALGMKRQPKVLRRRDGTEEPNPFWFEQGASKAIRNAILNMTPQEIQQRVIQAYKERGQVKVVEMAPDAQGEMLEDAHASFPKNEEEKERAALIESISTLIRDEQIPKAKVAKLKELWLGDQNADPKKATVDALRALREQLA